MNLPNVAIDVAVLGTLSCVGVVLVAVFVVIFTLY